ncbi:hypothetical protein M1P56_16480 [Streptomyces sp. HU2014]|uniref:hypothetical protein n=1 Tax=Streptomyces sp. HU2014 TaxID=2939414 RepID=UPI00200DF797|nr:hypothetical protein [Streptomyces sp. HU2014]UQI45840.1 hypothetical protein M1P56_16480 [Streptomyces sp. HU2014]
MTELQNRWYNAVSKDLPASPSTAQLIQPAPLLEPSDVALWARENTVPPASLTFNRQVGESPFFFDEYAAVIQSLSAPESTLVTAIGAGVHREWLKYLKTLPVQPDEDRLPEVFHAWAMTYHPEVANEGASALRDIVRLRALQRLLRSYQGPPPKPAEYLGGSRELLSMLGNSRSATISFDSATTSGDVSGTWTGGVNKDFSGLWAGAGRLDAITAGFARSVVTVEAELGAYVVWPVNPDPRWYDSSQLHEAYTKRTSPPWASPPQVHWDMAFGERSGRLQRAIASLLIVERLTSVVTSDAVFPSDDQRVIKDKAAAGLWPFYVPTGDGATNKADFDKGRPRLETTAPAGRPLVIGAHVLPIARYLGGSSTTSGGFDR